LNNSIENYRKIILLASPIILANLSTPLLGLVDTAVIGQIGDAALLGAVAISSMLFSFLFWGFGFLRMGTTALLRSRWGAENAKVPSTPFCRLL